MTNNQFMHFFNGFDVDFALIREGDGEGFAVKDRCAQCRFCPFDGTAEGRLGNE